MKLFSRKGGKKSFKRILKEEKRLSRLECKVKKRMSGKPASIQFFFKWIQEDLEEEDGLELPRNMFEKGIRE
ncbi:MAG: hypothetical protein J7L38_02260 [Thermoproteales archaeon]|nr:hypothetical protein [Thermoproteales archaeon]